MLHVGLFGFVRALTTPPPIPKPVELSNPDEIAARFGVDRAFIEETPPPPAGKATTAAAPGVKDPGAHDTKKQGGGKKMADAEGKLGKNGKDDHTELPGEIKNGLGGVSDVLAGETGDEIKHTLGTISSVAAALGGLNSQNIVLGMGSGTGLKGPGPAAAARAPAFLSARARSTPAGAPGNGGGFGSGSGGPGGAGRGGNGLGGTGSGTGTRQRQRASTSSRWRAAEARAAAGCPQEQIRRVVMAHLGALRACYESEVEKNPNLKGGVTVAWHIEPGGSVSGANVAGSSLGNPRVEGCVVRQVRAWHFPSSDKPSDVSWPFKFGVSGG